MIRRRAGLYVPRATAGYSGAVLADTPLVYLRMGETSGSTAVDASGNARNGLYAATKTATTGLLTGDADGATAQRGTISPASWMDVAAITLECLLKPTNTNNNAGILARFGGTGHVWIMWIDTSSKIAIRFYNTGGSQVDLSWATTPTTGTIYHVAATYQSGQARLYINGTQVASSTAMTGTLKTAAEYFEWHAYQSTFEPNATIDEVAIYSGELSSTRIAAHAALI